MAVPQVSKMITDRQRQCEFAEEFVLYHRPALVEAIDLLAQQDLEEGQPVPDVAGVADWLSRRLRRTFTGLTEAERRHLDEIANDAQYRERRDLAVNDLSAMLFDLRAIFRGAFGNAKAQEAGFERRIAQRPLALIRQTRRILGKLRDPGYELPPSRHTAVAVTRESVVESLEPPAQELRDAVTRVTREQTKVQGTQVAKDAAMADFDETYLLFVRILVAVFRLAGQRELAARLELSVRRRAQTPEETADPAPETSSDDASAAG